MKRPICTGKFTDRIGKLTDLIFKLAEPYPEAVGIYISHGWGEPNPIALDRLRTHRVPSGTQPGLDVVGERLLRFGNVRPRGDL